MGKSLYIVRLADWRVDCAALQAVRRAVFIEEQQVPEALEWDELDGDCRHVLAVSGAGVPIGTGRLLPDARIGRMAVLWDWRRRGVGSAILGMLLELARAHGHKEIVLHAQTHALGFYARHGFEIRGSEFMEAGIPHHSMALGLAQASCRTFSRPLP